MRRVTISSVAVERTQHCRVLRDTFTACSRQVRFPAVGTLCRHYPTLCRHYQCCLGFISSERSARPQP